MPKMLKFVKIEEVILELQDKANQILCEDSSSSRSKNAKKNTNLKIKMLEPH